MADAAEVPFDEWAILELMGHRKLAGRVQDVSMFGTRMCRIDIPSDPPSTQFYGGSAVFGVHPTTEAVCRSFAARAPVPQPVSRWELAPEPALPSDTRDDDEDVEQDFENEPENTDAW